LRVRPAGIRRQNEDILPPETRSGTPRRVFLRTAIAGCGALVCTAQPADHQSTVADPLSGIGRPARQLLLAATRDNSFRGRIPAATVTELLKLEKKTADDLMLRLVPLAKTFSRPPLSNFVVGAVIRGSSGSFYLGANIEVPGRSLGLAVHAEQAALANAYMSGEAAVAAIALGEAPCGHCRQFLYEASPDGELRVLVTGAPPAKLATLLPMAFGPKDMGLKQGLFPIRRRAISLSPRPTDPLILAALDAAQQSYSPYTSSPSGIAIATRDLRVFQGSYLENAAFNPSLPPLEAAMAGLFAARKDAHEVVRAVLVESASSRITQENATRDALSSLAPKARIDVLKARV